MYMYTYTIILHRARLVQRGDGLLEEARGLGQVGLNFVCMIILSSSIAIVVSTSVIDRMCVYIYIYMLFGCGHASRAERSEEV